MSDIVAQNGIYRSEDPLFKTFKKIREGRQSNNFNPIAFSILPSGIYMNDENGSLIRSADNGDTWEHLGSKNTYANNINGRAYMVFDSTVIFNNEDNTTFQSSDFKRIQTVNDFDVTLIDFNKLGAYPIYDGQKLDSILSLGNQYVSKDLGKSWANESRTIEGNRLYYFKQGINCDFYFYLSNDKGKTWKNWKLPINFWQPNTSCPQYPGNI